MNMEEQRRMLAEAWEAEDEAGTGRLGPKRLKPLAVVRLEEDVKRLEAEVAELRAEIVELKSDDVLADRLARIQRRR